MIDVAFICGGCVIAAVAFGAFQHAPRAGQPPIATASRVATIASTIPALPAVGAVAQSTEVTLSAAVATVAASRPALPAVPRSPISAIVATGNPQGVSAGSATGRSSVRAGRTSATAPAGIPYVDPHGAFSFIRPVDWRMLPPQATGVAVQFVAEKLRGNLNVVTQPVPASMTVDLFAAAAVAEIERMYPAYPLDARGIEPTIVGGEPARQYVFQGVQDGTPIVFTQVVALKDGIAYIVTLTAPADESSAFAAQGRVVIETFAFPA